MKETGMLNLRIKPDLKNKAQVLAESDERSLSNWIKKLIMDRVDRAEISKHDREKRRSAEVDTLAPAQRINHSH